MRWAAAISVPWVQRPSAPTALYSRSIKPVRVTANPKRASSSLPVITGSGTLDRCELTYTQRGANGSPYDSTETVSVTGPFLLRAQWLPGDVHCAGVAVDRQGAVAARYGTWTESARLCG